MIGAGRCCLRTPVERHARCRNVMHFKLSDALLGDVDLLLTNRPEREVRWRGPVQDYSIDDVSIPVHDRNIPLPGHGRI